MRALSLFATVLFAGCVGACLAGCGGGPGFSSDELARMHLRFLEEHNAVRSAPEPAADPPLPAFDHDNALAGVAQQWAQGCKFEHSGNGFGENLAFFSGGDSTPATVVAAWAAEVADYDYQANTCADGAQCGHYTQIVWRDTETVGCGEARCNVGGFDGILWVCNYNPPGNYVGEQPY